MKQGKARHTKKLELKVGFDTYAARHVINDFEVNPALLSIQLPVLADSSLPKLERGNWKLIKQAATQIYSSTNKENQL